MIRSLITRGSASLHKRKAQKLYGAIVARARENVFYRDLDVRDTLEGRFEMLVLHVFAVLEHLKAAGEGKGAVRQEIVDSFFADMDTVLRELGTGDVAVPKRMRNLADAFYARLQAYGAARASGQPLGGQIVRYVYDDRDEARDHAESIARDIEHLIQTLGANADGPGVPAALPPVRFAGSGV